MDTSQTTLRTDLTRLHQMRDRLGAGGVPSDAEIDRAGLVLASLGDGWICLHSLGDGFLHGPGRPHDTRRGALQQAVIWRIGCVSDHLTHFQDEDDRARAQQRSWN